MKLYTKESLIEELLRIREMGWVRSIKPGNAGAVGNTLEYLLGIKENNLPIPNASEWEIKTQRAKTSSLTTLFHLEPSPQALKYVPSVFLPKYGWPHKLAGTRYSVEEMSFRQTINSLVYSSRGFRLQVDNQERKLLVSFNHKSVHLEHQEWLKSVEQRVGYLEELHPQPYWGFDDLFYKAGTKLRNCFYVRAEEKREKGEVYFHYNKIWILQGLSLENLINSLVGGNILVDFDARTGHNHGTKFRLRPGTRTLLHEHEEEIE